MDVGILTRSYAQPTLEGVLDAVVANGLRHVQLSLSSDSGMADLPESLDDAYVERVRRALVDRGIVADAVSGTFNMAHPEPAERESGLRRLDTLAAASHAWGSPVITLCTGSRNTESMWRRHPDNDTPKAWRDMAETMAGALRIADERDVVLALEPEVANVVHSAERARRLLDEMRSPRLKIVMDGANIYHHGELPRRIEILEEAFRLLGGDIALAHAKDFDRDGEAGHLPAGHGLLDYDRYVRLLHESGYRGAIILHGLNEQQVPGCVEFLRDKIAAATAS